MGLIDWFKKREEKTTPPPNPKPKLLRDTPMPSVSVQLQFNPRKQDSISVESLVKMLDDVKTIYPEHGYVSAHELVDKISNTISKLHSTHTISMSKIKELNEAADCSPNS